MAALTLHYHPLSSHCQRVLIAIDLLGVDVERRLLNLADPAERAAHLALWPLGKMPLLVDRGRVIPETSIIIEHLQRTHAQHGARLIPDEADAAIAVRLWDRLVDLYVMIPMQALTADLLTPQAERDPRSVERARATLSTSYAVIDRQLQGRTWLAGDTFSMADCTAAPSLFYAMTYLPVAPEHAQLAAYFERLLEHPAVAAVIDHARPYFRFYPGRAGLSRRFFDPVDG